MASAPVSTDGVAESDTLVNGKYWMLNKGASSLHVDMRVTCLTHQTQLAYQCSMNPRAISSVSRTSSESAEQRSATAAEPA